MSACDRREFLNRSTAAGLSLAAGAAFSVSPRTSRAAGEQPEANGPQVVTFTKSFQDRSIPEVCRIFKELGLDGLDLTVRPGGHIQPEDVADELPRAVDAAEKQGLKIPMLTTAITDDDEDARRVLGTAAELGIGRVKMGYYRYRDFGTLAKQMQAVRNRMASVARMARRYGVLPCVHIHSGPFIPSHGTMLYELIREFDPGEIGAYVDPLHMTVEGGRDGWRQGLDLLAPWIGLVSVKNFIWEKGKRDKHGQLHWHTRLVPVADGIAPLPEFVQLLQKLGYNGIYSMHSEYKGGHSFKDMTTEECIRQTAEDLAFFRPLLS